MTNKTMTAYASDLFGTDTFKLMPASLECPFNEAIYDPKRGVLAIVGKSVKEKPMMMPRLDENGAPAVKKGVKTGNPEMDTAYQRVIMPQYYEYFIEDKVDILEFLQLHVINPPEEVLNMVVGFTPATGGDDTPNDAD